MTSTLCDFEFAAGSSATSRVKQLKSVLLLRHVHTVFALHSQDTCTRDNFLGIKQFPPEGDNDDTSSFRRTQRTQKFFSEPPLVSWYLFSIHQTPLDQQ